MSLGTTTLSAAVTAGATAWPLASSSGLSLPSQVAGLDPVQYAYCDGEVGLVTGFLGNNTVAVQRGQLGSRVGAHASGATVYLARAADLYQADPFGVPPAVPAVSPWINTVTGTVWVVLDGVWVQTDALTATAEASYDSTTDGAQTLLTSDTVDRSVIIGVTVTEAFADGLGTQTTFEIGQTGTADKFAATSEFTDALIDTTYTFSGTLSAGASLLVTAVAATSDGTGAIDVTAIAVPT